MAVQLSASLWLMNNEIGSLLEGKQGWCGRIQESDLEKLSKLREKYYKLSENSTFEPGNPLIDDRVVIINLQKERLVYDDKKQAYELFSEVANILKRNRINADVYRRLEKAFEEMGEIPSEDTKKAIDYATSLKSLFRSSEPKYFCWEDQKNDTLPF